MGAGRWLVWPALLLSGILWLGMSVVASDAVHILVKSNFDFARSFGSVSAKSLASALVWPVVVGCWLGMSTPVGAKSLALSACVVSIWAVGVTVLTAVGIDLSWSHRWAVVALSIASLVLEVAVAAWLLHWVVQPLSFASGVPGTILNITVALAWLMATKAILLFCSPGVVIR